MKIFAIVVKSCSISRRLRDIRRSRKYQKFYVENEGRCKGMEKLDVRHSTGNVLFHIIDFFFRILVAWGHTFAQQYIHTQKKTRVVMTTDKIYKSNLPTNYNIYTQPSTVCVAGCTIAVTDTLKTLGVQTEQRALTFNNHVNDIATVCNFRMPALQRHVRRFLPRHVANIVCGTSSARALTIATRCSFARTKLYSTNCGAFKTIRRF